MKPCCRNRQVTVFYDIIGFLQPGFVLMEQVADTWKKQGGVYTRYASGMSGTQESQRTSTLPDGLPWAHATTPSQLMRMTQMQPSYTSSLAVRNRQL